MTTSLSSSRHASSVTHQQEWPKRTLAMKCCLALAVLVLGQPMKVRAQVNVLTAHNDIARTGQNLQETILTPANVNATSFGRLFSQPVSGTVYAQPLYASKLTIPGKGVHNVVYLVTSADQVYAFDADTNGGTSASPLWQVSLLTNTAGLSLKNRFGIVGTPVIDLPSGTMYLVSSEVNGSADIARLHALDITTGAEKFGGPVSLQASVAGTGNASVNGVLAFDPSSHYQRPGLLLLNGVVYIAFGSINDQGPWHGWVLSYKATSLQPISALCTTANGSGGGIWMGGSGLAAEVNNAAKPYGRLFLTTGNGTYNAQTPYSNSMNYAMSLVDVDLTGGVLTVTDEFSPYNHTTLNSQDADLGSGGPILLPAQTTKSGAVLNALVEVAKSGMLYILNRNFLGGYNPSGDVIVQEVQTPLTPGYDWGAGVWGTEAYWNGYIYSGGTNVASGSSYAGSGTSMSAYSYNKGVLSQAPISQTNEKFIYPGPTPAISANGNSNGILWALMTYAQAAAGSDVLLAYDATNLANTLYSSDTNLSRDNPGLAVKYTVPTVANGKVYVGAVGSVSIYGLLGSTPTAPSPVITPGSQTYSGTVTVSISDAVPGATIYYTTNGATPTVNSSVYTSPLRVSSNVTITAVASATGYVQSTPASATYRSTSTTANPVISLASGTYSGAQALTISDSSVGAKIYYTLDGSTPTTGSTLYQAPLSVQVSESINAIAIAPSLYASPTVSATYTIVPAYIFNYSNGFSNAGPTVRFNGSTDLDDFRLQLTNGGKGQSGSAFYVHPVNIQAFTTDFTFQQSNPAADGMTFTIQGQGPSAIGGGGPNLGYGGIANSLAIKFDLYSNAGEGPDSTGLYLNGATPTMPAVNLTGTGIDLHSGDYMNAHITYDGVNLTLTLTDAITSAAYSKSFAINIPVTVGGNTAYVGFTGGTGGLTSSQKVTSWSYIAAPLAVPNYPAGFDSVGLRFNDATMNGSRLRLTDGGTGEARSAFFNVPVSIQSFSSHFDFQITNPKADGFTFTLQNAGPLAVGGGGANLGYGTMPTSAAIKFDIHNNEGEGSDSTGFYKNGAVPTLNDIDLSSTGIDLHSGDIFHVSLNYDGTTLTVVITDTATQASATQSYTTNLPAALGGSTAYIGFTGGTGGASAIQEILNWSYTPGSMD